MFAGKRAAEGLNPDPVQDKSYPTIPTLFRIACSRRSDSGVRAKI